MIELAVTNPNFSVVVPTTCNANCEFCFWEYKKDVPSKKQYLEKLALVLSKLPKEFVQCSITGGEPTLLEWLPEILMLTRKRFKKVVLSSNGYSLRSEIFQYIDHLNISRHHYNDAENMKVFNGAGIPDDGELADICQRANDAGVDVTLNCVVPPDFNDEEFLMEYLTFTKQVGANGVCFRKVHSDLEDLPIEAAITAKVVEEGSCPVCKSKVRLMYGLRTTWRYSVLEPSKVMKGVYELVMQPNGDLTKDWEGLQLIAVKTQIQAKAEEYFKPDLLPFPKKPEAMIAGISSGCGGGYFGTGCGGGGGSGSVPVKKVSYSSCGGSSSGC